MVLGLYWCRGGFSCLCHIVLRLSEWDFGWYKGEVVGIQSWMKSWVYVTKGAGVKLSVVLVKVSQALSDLVEYRGFGW